MVKHLLLFAVVCGLLRIILFFQFFLKRPSTLHFRRFPHFPMVEMEGIRYDFADICIYGGF